MWSSEWDQVFRSQAWGKYPAEDVIRFVARNYYQTQNRESVRILEVGCGPGANLWYLAAEGFSFCGVDGSKSALELAEMRLDAEAPGWRRKGSLHHADVEKLPFPEGHFDATIDNECIYCNDFESSAGIYDEIARVTRLGGRLFSRTFAIGSWGDGTGNMIGRNYWSCGEGPLKGRGPSRFTFTEEVPDLIRKFAINSIETLSRTEENGTKTIRELMILGTRKPD